MAPVEAAVPVAEEPLEEPAEPVVAPAMVPVGWVVVELGLPVLLE